MRPSRITFADLTVNSADDELFPGIEDLNAQAALQLRAALLAFEDGVFASSDRANALHGDTASGTGAATAKAQPRNRRQQVYAARIPEDRQSFRPVGQQAAEWAAFKPHLWLRGRQLLAPTPGDPTPPTPPAPSGPLSPAPTQPPHLTADSPERARAGGAPPPATTASASTGAQEPQGDEGTQHPVPYSSCLDSPTEAEGECTAELVVRGRRVGRASPELGVQTDEEVVCSHGDLQEIFAVQYDRWANPLLPVRLRPRRPRGGSRDGRAVAVGLPPVEPKTAVLYDVVQTLLPELWCRLSPLLAPHLPGLAEQRQQQQQRRARLKGPHNHPLEGGPNDLPLSPCAFPGEMYGSSGEWGGGGVEVLRFSSGGGEGLGRGGLGMGSMGASFGGEGGGEWGGEGEGDDVEGGNCTSEDGDGGAGVGWYGNGGEGGFGKAQYDSGEWLDELDGAGGVEEPWVGAGVYGEVGPPGPQTAGP